MSTHKHFFRHFPDYPCHTPQISMTEINQGIFCTLFQKFQKIQLFSIISLINENGGT